MTKLKLFLAAMAGVIFGFVPKCDGAVCTGYLTLQAEMPTIRKAAERNGIKYGSDNWFILLAIRKAENGRDGLQFGIMNPIAYNLDKQAGWASATIMKNRKRWAEAGTPGTFIEFLGRRYCPRKDDPAGHKNWIYNVNFFYNKYKNNNLDILQ